MDAITAPLELCWASEAFVRVTSNKRTLYDTLSLPEWALGQPKNIYQIEDSVTVKSIVTNYLNTERFNLIALAGRRATYGNPMNELE